MNSRVKLFSLLLAMVLVIGAAYFGYQKLSERGEGSNLVTYPGGETTVNSEQPGSSSTEPSEAEVVLAPDFTVYTLDGQALSLAAMRGKPVVLNFWASWCPPCKEEMPDFESVFRELGDEVQFMMVNVTDGERETVEKGQAYVDAEGFTFPIFYDTDQDAAYQYGISSIPTTYFIDADGVVVAGSRGMIDEEVLRRGIEMIQP